MVTVVKHTQRERERGQTDRQRWMDGWTDGLIDNMLYSYIDRYTERYIDKLIVRHTHTGTQKDR